VMHAGFRDSPCPSGPADVLRAMPPCAARCTDRGCVAEGRVRD
jgi:hypothetical protein